MIQRLIPALAIAAVIVLGACGSDTTEETPGASIPAMPSETLAETPPDTTEPDAASGATGTSKDKKGDEPPELDLVKFSARRAGGEVVMKWTLAAPPNGTLVAAMSDEAVVAAVKVYEGGGKVDAYVFDGENTPLDSYEIDGNVVTLRVPDVDLGLGFSTLEPSTERVGGGPADAGKPVDVP
jgi:hypothetical protein